MKKLMSGLHVLITLVYEFGLSHRVTGKVTELEYR